MALPTLPANNRVYGLYVNGRFAARLPKMGWSSDCNESSLREESQRPMKDKSIDGVRGTVAGPPRYLPWDEVIELTGMSRSTLKRAIRDGEFPAPRKLTRGRVGFRQDEIATWVETRPRVEGKIRGQQRPPLRE